MMFALVSRSDAVPFHDPEVMFHIPLTYKSTGMTLRFQASEQIHSTRFESFVLAPCNSAEHHYIMAFRGLYHAIRQVSGASVTPLIRHPAKDIVTLCRSFQ